MSELNTKATVTLQVNGQQAEQTLQQLKNNALQLESAIARAAASGNKTDLKRLRRELTDTKRQIREIESASSQVEQVLKRLDRATPKELSRTLATLNKQLDYMERGSDAWNSHVEKIKRVKAEIASVNEDLRNQEGLWSRFNRTINDWQTTIMGAAAAMTGLVMAGRAAVSAYAEMDAEMANVRKFTGMNEEQVKELNEEFKKINTRTGREELNKLAQEAGRLGKSSQEDVLGFVRAADQINVALDDLGEGATLVLSKLGTIFGDEKRLGTEKALLAIGSVINELSQNCTASAPYLAQFAQRMAGVGAQANMTIPQIMGFAAVLDSQGQAVEMSATALSKLIMDMFKQQDKIIKATGLNAENFNETLKRSTNEGLLMLIQRLHELGNIDVLAPVFKEMGENGARAAQVISALAGNLEMVRWEQEEAAKAFAEGTSVSKEFEVQNNTVQAGLDKARKGVTELAVELGEKLKPVMSHVISSTTLLMRAMSTTIDFMIDNWSAIQKVVIVLAAYTIGVNAHTIATKAAAIALRAWNAIMAISTTVTKGYTAAMLLSKDAITGCSLANQRLYRLMLQQNIVTKLLTASTLVMKAAYYACTLNISALSATLKSLYVVMASNPYGLILASLAAVGAAIYSNVQKKKEQLRILEEERQKEREQMKEYDAARAKISMLSKVLNDNTRNLMERKAALEELKKIVPDYHADLTSEGLIINNNTEALENYLNKLKESILMRANREKLEEKYKKQNELEDRQKELSDAYWAERQKNTSQGYDRNSIIAKSSRLLGLEKEAALKKDLDETEKELRDIQREIEELEKKVSPEAISTTPEKAVEPAEMGVISQEGSESNKDKFAKEDEWRKQQEALNRIAYAKGEKDYMQFTERMREIEVDYHKQKLQHTDLSEAERLQIEADYYEVQKKISESAHKRSIDEENAAYAEHQALLKQRFIDGETSYEVYQEATEQLEMKHLMTLSNLYEQGSKEQEQAQSALQEKLFQNQRKHQKDIQEKEKEHQESLKRIKEKVFGMNASEREAAYISELNLLLEVYHKELDAAEENAAEKLRIEEAFQKARMALMEEYNIEGSEQNRNFLQEWNSDVLNFLDSDLGKAVSGTVDTLVSGMSSIFQQLTTIVQAELESQEASINKRYDAEVSLAEGNNYKINQLEKQRESELTKARKDANKKMFAMQVIQAVAQTAQAALNAYSSAAAIPVTGWILAPIAASMAVAAGALQIAAIKKQQQASEAQGYKAGGFTPEGSEDEVAGVVHAGEWVASQRLVKNPHTRPILEALDYAQRTNTIGSLSAETVSTAITAPARLAQAASSFSQVPQKIVVENQQQNASSLRSITEMTQVIGALKKRLDEPFVTVNSVTGDIGMKQAQDEYQKLMRNKTPKSRR